MNVIFAILAGYIARYVITYQTAPWRAVAAYWVLVAIYYILKEMKRRR
jgi:hypothetical protein